MDDIFFNKEQRLGAHGYDSQMDLEAKVKSRHYIQPIVYNNIYRRESSIGPNKATSFDCLWPL